MFSSELFSFQGRASRSKFWLVFLLSIFVSFVVVLFSILALPALIFMGTFSPKLASIVSMLLYVLMIPMWWISIATSVKRFHDRNKSGWWYLIVLIPFIGGLWIIIENGFLGGTVGANNFGPDSLSGSTVTNFAPGTAVVPPLNTTPSEMANWKLVALIVGGVILLAFIGRAIWAYQAVKSDEAKATPETSTTNSEVKSDTFTTAQLANLKADMTAFYLKYQDKDQTAKNTEPLQSQHFKEMDAIFLKDLGVVTKITANDFGSASILLQPEIATIISDIETQYGKPKNVPVAVVPTSKIVISNLSHSSVLISDLSKYATKALTFSVTNVGLAKELCKVTYTTYLDDPKNHPLNRPDTICNPYYSNSKSGYSDSVYFSNLASSYSGGYDGTSRNYFEIEGIDNTLIEFYLKDTSGKESNRLQLTITGPIKKVNTQSTASPTVSINNVSPASPSVSFALLNDNLQEVSSLSVTVGGWINYSWHSKNADNIFVVDNHSGCSDPSQNGVGSPQITSADGSSSNKVTSRIAGCTIKSTFVAKNTQTKDQAIATVTVTVK